MRNPLNETAPREEEDPDREKVKTTGVLQNHLGPKTKETELRLGFSSSGFEDTGSVAEGGQKLSRFVLRQKNSGFGGKRWYSETEGGFANPWKEEKAVFDPSHQQRRIDLCSAARQPHNRLSVKVYSLLAQARMEDHSRSANSTYCQDALKRSLYCSQSCF